LRTIIGLGRQFRRWCLHDHQSRPSERRLDRQIRRFLRDFQTSSRRASLFHQFVRR